MNPSVAILGSRALSALFLHAVDQHRLLRPCGSPQVSRTAESPKVAVTPVSRDAVDYRHKKGVTEIGTAHMQDIWA